ncbi:MAG: rod shape-determining protein RodA [Patescibacteria group bacterium]|nr:rod shape-determining protein RodA [Patescibacteria group bacterium]MBU4141885.1 rod shape-determining protein RodA [Patescibacteria group bacterium]
MNIGSIKNIDWFLLILVIILVVFGLAAIYSTSFDSTKIVNFQKQAIFSVIGFVSMAVIILMMDYRMLRTYSGILYLGAVLFLILTIATASMIRGVYSWFDFGSFSFQPTEFIKIILVVSLAKYFSTRDIGDFKHVIISSIYAVIFIALIALQPDMGMAAIFVIIWVSMSVAAGLKFKHFVVLALVLAISGAFSWGYVFKDYQKDRILIFMDPYKDPQKRGYNIIQSKIAIGSGGLLGKGFGRGTQSQLNFLPEKYSDFIFAAIAEESGFLGVTMLFIIFTCVFRQIFSVIKKINDSFGKLLIFGGGVMIFSGFFINIASNLALVPVTGIPLPFISYGGSSLVATFITIGLIQNVIIRNEESYKIKDNIIDSYQQKC